MQDIIDSLNNGTIEPSTYITIHDTKVDDVDRVLSTKLRISRKYDILLLQNNTDTEIHLYSTICGYLMTTKLPRDIALELLHNGESSMICAINALVNRCDLDPTTVTYDGTSCYIHISDVDRMNKLIDDPKRQINRIFLIGNEICIDYPDVD